MHVLNSDCCICDQTLVTPLQLSCKTTRKNLVKIKNYSPKQLQSQDLWNVESGL